MTTDADIETLIKADEMRMAKLAKEPPAEPRKKARAFTTAEQKKRVWVKCITENRPWTSEETYLEAWKTYEIPYPDAVMMEANNHIVIVQPPEEK